VYHFPYPDTFRPPFSGTDEEIADYHLDLIRRAFADYIPGEEVAAVIIEPIQGAAGILVPPVSFMKGVRSLCDAHGILLIAEEVQQGLGRTGKWFGIEHFGIVPDAVILGKALGSGLPLSAIVAGRTSCRLGCPGALLHPCGKAVCCAAAYASVQVIEEEGLIAHSEEMGNYLMERFRVLQDSYPLIGDVRGKWLSIGVDLVKDGKTRERHGEAAAKICYQAWQKGLLLSFFSGSVLRIQPPLVITREEADRALEIIEEAMRDFLAGRISDEVLKTVKGW
jgi:4-aminobutyrate aminotransferase